MDIMLFMKNMECRLHELELTIKSFVRQYEGEDIQPTNKPAGTLTNDQLMNSFNLINDPVEACQITTGDDECDT